MELADILAEESVLVCTEVTGKPQLLALIAQKAATLTGLSADIINATLTERESLGSTGLGNGIAIPHGKLDRLGGVTALFVKLGSPIEFDAIDDQPVDLVMMLLAPVGSGADHLKALAKVARLLRTESVVSDLRAASTPGELYRVLTTPVQAHKAA